MHVNINSINMKKIYIATYRTNKSFVNFYKLIFIIILGFFIQYKIYQFYKCMQRHTMYKYTRFIHVYIYML